MACARVKEEIHLRIFRPKGLLVAFEVELDLLAELIADGFVFNFGLEVQFRTRTLMRARVTL